MSEYRDDIWSVVRRLEERVATLEAASDAASNDPYSQHCATCGAGPGRLCVEATQPYNDMGIPHDSRWPVSKPNRIGLPARGGR